MFSGRKLAFVIALIALWSTAAVQGGSRKKTGEAKPATSAVDSGARVAR